MTSVLHPFESGTFALRMGVRPLSLDTWLEVDRATIEEQLALKRELISGRQDEMVVAVDRPEVIAACQELDDLVVGWWSGRSEAPSEPDRSFHPIVRAALRTQEDWCLLDGPAGEVPVLVAGCVCFPTRWILTDKVGRTTVEIHRPVAFYNDQLAVPVDRFLDRLRVGAPVWRANWNLVDDDALCQAYLPAPGRRLTCSALDVADLVHLRVERQTLRRLPNSGSIAFGIRVHQESLRALEADPEVLSRLLSAIRGLPPETFAYKGLTAFWPELEAWLMSRTRR